MIQTSPTLSHFDLLGLILRQLPPCILLLLNLLLIPRYLRQILMLMLRMVILTLKVGHLPGHNPLKNLSGRAVDRDDIGEALQLLSDFVCEAGQQLVV
jgi:hypothetical protein